MCFLSFRPSHLQITWPPTVEAPPGSKNDFSRFINLRLSCLVRLHRCFIEDSARSPAGGSQADRRPYLFKELDAWQMMACSCQFALTRSMYSDTILWIKTS